MDQILKGIEEILDALYRMANLLPDTPENRNVRIKLLSAANETKYALCAGESSEPEPDTGDGPELWADGMLSRIPE